MKYLADVSITISASTVAWYAALMASASAAVAFYNAWRDHPRLKVTAKPNMRIDESRGDYDKSKTYILLEVCNVGKRPVTLKRLPFFSVKGDKKKGMLIIGSWMPRERLDEGESATMLACQDSLDVSLLTGIVVVNDEAGRVWKGKLTVPVKEIPGPSNAPSEV